MYQYDEYDQALVSERVAQFRDQIARRLDGELSEEEFLRCACRNGLYLQKHAYMLRVAIPSAPLVPATARAGACRPLLRPRLAGTSPRGRTSSSTGSNWSRSAISSNTSPARRCMRSRPPATACATSPPKPSPGSPRTNGPTPGRWPRSCASGRR
ncbi:hypothetical protein ACPA9J_09535 [Pseudomonas aeruginosa]